MAKDWQLPNSRSRWYYRLAIEFIVTLAAVLGWLLVAIAFSMIDSVAVDRLFPYGTGSLWANGYSSSLLLSYLATRIGAIGAVGVCLGQALYNCLFKQRKNRGFIITFLVSLGLVVVAALYIFREAPAILTTPPEIISKYAHYPNEFYDAAGHTLLSLQLAAMLRLSVGLPLSIGSLVIIALNNWRSRKAGTQPAGMRSTDNTAP